MSLGDPLREEIKRERDNLTPRKHEESRKVTTYEPFPEGPPEDWPTEYVSLDSYEALRAANEKLVEDLQEMDSTAGEHETWEQQHVESWTAAIYRLVTTGEAAIASNTTGNIQAWLDAKAAVQKGI